MRAVTEGTEAMGEVSLKMMVNDKFTIVGRGASTDILEASAKAYVDGLNKIKQRMDNNPGHQESPGGEV